MGQASRVAGLAAGLGLGLLAALHLIWTFSPWPLDSHAALAVTVVGASDEAMPPGGLIVIVAAALAAAGYVVAARSGVLPQVGPPFLYRLGTWVVATTLLLRGVNGLLVSGLGLVETPAAFARWDVTLYSPISLLLGALALVVAADERFPDRPAGRVVWAGRIVTFIGLWHVVAWTEFAGAQLPDWLAGSVPGSGQPIDVALSQSEAYFWALPGSFAPIALLLGPLLSWLGRRGQAVPAAVGWGLGAWAVIISIPMPTPVLFLSVPAVLLIVAARNHASRRDAVPAPALQGATR